MPKKLITFAETKYKPTKWLWMPYIAFGKISIFAGIMGEGKTTLATEILSKFSNGLTVEGYSLELGKQKCLYVSAEDSYHEGLYRRFSRSGADMNNIIHFVDDDYSSGIPSPNDIEDAIKEYKINVVAIDPILAFMGNINIGQDNIVREKMEPYRRIADKYNVALLFVGHPNKNEKQSPLYRLSGSGAFGNLARCVSLVGRDPDDDRKLLLKCYKSNDAEIRNMDAHVWEFADDGTLKYIGTKEIGIDEIIDAHKKFQTKRNNKIEAVKGIIKAEADSIGEIYTKNNSLIELVMQTVHCSKATYYNARSEVISEYRREEEKQ